MNTRIYRKNYQPANYLIKTTKLIFTLLPDKVIVDNTMVLFKDPDNNTGNTLFLNGEQLELLGIKKNNQPIDYQLSKEGIALNNLEDKFTLNIKTQIYPHKNTALNGLYQSGGNFCTQCEAHGFRRISYYLDRPDVLSIFTTTIIANTNDYPVLLSNGNLIKTSDNQVVWHDPYPKPCYLFALVAGDFALLEDEFITKDNKNVCLRIYTTPQNITKTNFAMEALKKSFKWDEQRFDLTYDLSIYHLVAIDDFNMGAMENKSLNIFNSKYVLADINTATDQDFIAIESVIGHEYFHNWTGNRITCRDWFQLSLKEGLTVFRDQEFSADQHDKAIQRIDDVTTLKTYQFSEDAGTMSHPVRPESYLEMNNFYTATVYEKGAELVRMIHTILGEASFQAGMKLYVKRHDTQAVTIDDFIASMADANKTNLEQFKHWYSQKGTPVMNAKTTYYEQKQEYIIQITQALPKQQPAFYLPLAYALFDQAGNKMTQDCVIIAQKTQKIIVKNITSKPIASFLRGFSAPVCLNYYQDLKQIITLLKYEDDGFSAWENAQKLWQYLILKHLTEPDKAQIFQAFTYVLTSNDNLALVARLLTLPSKQYLYQQIDVIQVVEIAQKYEDISRLFALKNQAILLEKYQTLAKAGSGKLIDLSHQSMAKRALKNVCLNYLALTKQTQYYTLAYRQFKNANNMTDKFSALKALTYQDNLYRQEVLADFYQQYQDDEQVIDKWFSIQASANDANITQIKSLMQHDKFSLYNPNRLRSLLSVWTQNTHFHTQAGYQLLSKVIIELNDINPQIGARLAGVFNHHHRHTPRHGQYQRDCLKEILAVEALSNDILEIVKIALKDHLY